MNLRNRLNKLENKVTSLKNEKDNTIEVCIGVWYSDPETNRIIPGSGATACLPIDEANSYGILLTPAPVDKEHWTEVVKKCEQYQNQRKQEIEKGAL